MDLIDDDVAQVAKEACHGIMAVQQEGLKGFGRDLQDARGVLEQLCLMGCRDVPVPMPNGDVGLAAQVVQTLELVVDERLERADVERPDRRRRLFPELGENRKEGRLGFPRGG